MSGIQKRTVFYEPPNVYTGRYFKWLDWAEVITALGTCWEPTNIGDRWHEDSQNMADWSVDMINQVDDIRMAGRERQQVFYRDTDGTILHGGFCWPRKAPY